MFFKFMLITDFDGIPAQTVGVALSAPRGSAPGMAQFIVEGLPQPVLVPSRLLEPLNNQSCRLTPASPSGG